MSFLVGGFKNGFHIPIVSPVKGLHVYNNHSSLSTYNNHAKKLIDTELKHGRIAGPFNDPPFPDFVCSPIGLRPKKEPASFRIIHHLSFPPHTPHSVNARIPQRDCQVSYQTLDHVINILQHAGRGALMAKCDIQHAFRLLPVSPQCYHLLGFRFRGQYYGKTYMDS